MNELQLIRNQIATERKRAAELATVFAATPAPGGAAGGAAGPLRQACVDYLVFVLTRFEERDQMLADLVRGRFAEADATRRAIQESLARPGASREALARLEAALVAPDRSEQFATYLAGPWSARRDAIDSLQQAHLRVTDSRAVSFVDADSIMEERTRYSRVQSARGDNAA